jgi:hypothetical protein
LGRIVNAAPTATIPVMAIRPVRRVGPLRIADVAMGAGVGMGVVYGDSNKPGPYLVMMKWNPGWFSAPPYVCN